MRDDRYVGVETGEKRNNYCYCSKGLYRCRSLGETVNSRFSMTLHYLSESTDVFEKIWQIFKVTEIHKTIDLNVLQTLTLIAGFLLTAVGTSRIVNLSIVVVVVVVVFFLSFYLASTRGVIA